MTRKQQGDPVSVYPGGAGRRRRSLTRRLRWRRSTAWDGPSLPRCARSTASTSATARGDEALVAPARCPGGAWYLSPRTGHGAPAEPCQHPLATAPESGRHGGQARALNEESRGGISRGSRQGRVSEQASSCARRLAQSWSARAPSCCSRGQPWRVSLPPRDRRPHGGRRRGDDSWRPACGARPLSGGAAWLDA